MTTDPPFDPTAPLAGPPEPWESAPTPSRRVRSAVSHDRHDRGRAGAGRPDPRAPWRAPAALPRRSPAAVRATLEAGDPVIVTGCGTSEHGALAVAARSCARRRRAAGLPSAHDLRRAGVRAVAGAAGPWSRDRHHPRGRDGRHQRRARGGSIGRRADRRRSRSAAAHRRARWPRSSSRPTSSTTAGVTPSAISARSWPPPRSARTCPVARSTAPRSTRLLADGARDETGADGDRGGPRRCGAAPRHRVGCGPPGRPRARAQGRGGVVAAVGLPRSRDVPPRPPARHRTDDRASSSS